MKPILFNTEMVRAILEGRKTVTRRVVKPQPGSNGMVKMSDQSCYPGYWAEVDSERVIKPPYQSGDVLYVREAWTRDCIGNYIFRADYWSTNGANIRTSMHKWHPSIHMPREAARIFLRVTEVSVERLQDITPIQAQREGTPDSINYHVIRDDAVKLETVKFGIDDAIECFRSIWYQAVKDADRHIYGWEANPWVWVIEFVRVEAGKDGETDSSHDG